MSRITINGISIDPQADSVRAAAMEAVSTTGEPSAYAVIEIEGALTAEQRDQLQGAGALLLEFVPDNGYLARLEVGSEGAVAELPFVAWVGRYLRGFKISADLLGAPAGADAVAMMAAKAPIDGQALVDIVFHRGVSATDHSDELARVAGLDPSQLAMGAERIRASIPASRLSAISDLDVVRHIEPVFEAQLSNDVACKIIKADRVHASLSKLRGAGEIVAVCDTGFDQGGTTSVHPAFSGRVRRLVALGRPRSDDPHGHGTHVAGSVLGDGSVSGYGQLVGAAPEAQLVLQSVLDSSGGLRGLPVDLNDLFRDPYDHDGARIHTNSWGTRNSASRYTSFSRDVDEFVWEHRDQVICFAAGNPGRDANSNGVIDFGSVEAPGTAKNCITVGASESLRPDESKPWAGPWPSQYPAEPIASDPWADNPDGMAAFSGRGPTRDGRIKPDVVAPGTSILSAHSRNASVSSFWGTSPDPLYCFMGGTSMATPLVAGCTAVIRQYLRTERDIAEPTAALVKAVLINGAVELVGQYVPSEAGARPNHNEGFGRVDLIRSVGGDEPDRFDLYDEGRALATGDSFETIVGVSSPGLTAKVTLVWTDPPGESLQNDLDLIVTTGGVERRGNVRGEFPIGSGSTFDRKNNVEQVLWPAVPEGDMTIRVTAHRAAIFDQPFALVVRIASERAGIDTFTGSQK